ncbi:MAG: hypothetical protein R3C11_08545 [Planctomycetaceae bacterium]
MPKRRSARVAKESNQSRPRRRVQSNALDYEELYDRGASIATVALGAIMILISLISLSPVGGDSQASLAPFWILIGLVQLAAGGFWIKRIWF